VCSRSRKMSETVNSHYVFQLGKCQLIGFIDAKITVINANNIVRYALSSLFPAL
jgi:hypothetical protein